MNGLVNVQVFALQNPIALHRYAAAQGIAAILVIPYGGAIREPRLAIFPREDRAAPQGARLLLTDQHVVARCPGSGDGPELADVLVTRRSSGRDMARARAAGALRLLPGAELAVAAHPGGCVALCRGGPELDITGPLRPARLGSFLYGWIVAGTPLDELAKVAVLTGTVGDGMDELAIGGRIRFRLGVSTWRAVS
jgi:hypothetical protein